MARDLYRGKFSRPNSPPPQTILSLFEYVVSRKEAVNVQLCEFHILHECVGTRMKKTTVLWANSNLVVNSQFVAGYLCSS